MNTPDNLLPLLALLIPYYEDTRIGACGFVASSVNMDLARLANRPHELHSFAQVTVQVTFAGRPNIVLRGKTDPEEQYERMPSVPFRKAARGLWVPSAGEVAAQINASMHAVVLCKMKDGTYAILDGNEGQFAHMEGDCTFHVQASDLEMKGATLSDPPASA